MDGPTKRPRSPPSGIPEEIVPHSDPVNLIGKFNAAVKPTPPKRVISDEQAAKIINSLREKINTIMVFVQSNPPGEFKSSQMRKAHHDLVQKFIEVLGNSYIYVGGKRKRTRRRL